MKTNNSTIKIVLLNLRIQLICFLLLGLLFGNTIQTYGQYGGSTCQSAYNSPIHFTIDDPFYCENQTIYEQGNEYNSANTAILNSFSPTYFNGPDYLYYFTANSTGSVTINIRYENSTTESMSVSLFDAGYGYSLGNHITGSYDVSSYSHQPGVLTIGNINAGDSYYIVIDGLLTSIDSLENSQYSIEVFYNIISPPCTNLGFEEGNFSNWYGTSGKVQNCANPQAEHANYCTTEYGLNSPQHSIISEGLDQFGEFPCVFEGSYSAIIGDGTENGSNGAQLITTFEVSPESSYVTLNYAMVVNDGHHEHTGQSFIQISMYDQNGASIDCGNYLAIAGAEGLGFTESEVNQYVTYCEWQSVPTDLSDYIGQNITIHVTIGDCIYGAHFAYAYLDCSCEPADLVTSDCYPLNFSAPSSFDSYLWFPTGDTTRTIEDVEAGTYCCEVTRNSCILNICKEVIIEPLNYDITTTNSDCEGRNNGSATININGGIPNYSYFWSDSTSLMNTTLTSCTMDSLESGIYYASLTDGLGCDYFETFEILNNYEIGTNYILNQNVSCNGYSDGMVTIQPDNLHPPYSYFWPDSTHLATNSNLSAGSYIVTVVDDTGCLTNLDVEISEPDPLFEPQFNSSRLYGCEPLEVHFNLSDYSSEYTYQWNFTNDESFFQMNGTSSIISFTEGGNYNLTLFYQDTNSCVDSIYLGNLVRVYPKPDVSFYPYPERMDILHSDCEFTNLSDGAIYYFWDFGDGANSSIESPEHHYNSVGSYYVELIAFTEKACSDSIGVYVHVDDVFTFYAPNAIIPDNNGINDVFRVFGTGIDIETFDLYVFDRWGEQIFYTSDIEQGWD
ncbi:MAG: hypothetical protein C0596_17420 [Marinilabiliales bacterium]|nr:MAG: hypothetical protein C0596_17420 [Marinilabiliales bacterium]